MARARRGWIGATWIGHDDDGGGERVVTVVPATRARRGAEGGVVTGALPSVSVVVVNWNGRHFLSDCLASIAALDYPRDLLETVVLDNGSTDGSVDWLRQAWPAVRVLARERNLGFAAASNQAVDAAGGTLVALVNNDVRLEPKWLRRMTEALGAAGAAAAGSRVLDWDGRRYDFDGAAMNFYGHGASRRHGRPYAGDRAGPPVEALFACGAALLADRFRFLASGGFDDDYFAYFEDVDLGWRLWVEGERVVYVPDTLAYHHHHGSGLPAAERTRLLERNALATVVKNYDDANLAKVLPAALLLVEARARRAGPTASVYRDAVTRFLEALPALERKRTAVQRRRQRADRDIVPLFGEPFRPSLFGRDYWHEQQQIVRAFGITSLFGAGGAMEDFIGELQGRIEDLERELASARQAAAASHATGAAERARLGAEIERLRRELDERSRGGLRGLWRRLRTRSSP